VLFGLDNSILKYIEAMYVNYMNNYLLIRRNGGEIKVIVSLLDDFESLLSEG
jgi:hypothetical protein